MYFLQSLLPRFNFIMPCPLLQTRGAQRHGVQIAVVSASLSSWNFSFFPEWVLSMVHSSSHDCSSMVFSWAAASFRAYSSPAAWGPLWAAVWVYALARFSPWAAAEYLLWHLEHIFSDLGVYNIVSQTVFLTELSVAQQFLHFLIFISTDGPPTWLTGSAVLCNGSTGSGWNHLCPARSLLMQTRSAVPSKQDFAIYTQYQGYLLSTPNTCIYQATAMECSEQNRQTGQGTVVKMWLVSLCRQGMQEVHKADQFLLIWEWHSVTAVCAGMALFLACRCTTRGSTLDLS